MKAIIKSIILTDFKGVVGTETYNLFEKTKVCGKNGLGKTTISDAFYWAMADKDTELRSNPNIRPNNGRECTPTVTIEFEVDGKPVTVAKMQKMKKSKPDDKGVVKTSLTNSYEVNAVQKSEKQFKAYLEDLGFDFEKFLPLSHPDMFLKGMNEKKQKEAIRAVLFEMADTTISDLDIARQNRTKELADLLEKYTQDEVEAMQNSTKRKIAENYGREGEILRAKIEGMEASKKHIDVSSLKKQKTDITAAISDIQAKIDSADKKSEEYKKLSDNILNLRFKLTDMEREANAENEKNRQEIRRKINDTESEKGRISLDVVKLKRKLSQKESDIEADTKDIYRQRDFWKKDQELLKIAQERVFDDSSLVCPYCGQEYPEEKKDALRSEFESHKAKEIEKIKDDIERIEGRGSALKDKIKDSKSEVEKIHTEIDKMYSQIADLDKMVDTLTAEMNTIPDSVDISQDKDYLALQKEISEKESAMNAERDTNTTADNLKIELSENQAELTEIEKQIALAEHDKEIDKEIEALREKGMEYEQNLADCEKILYQIGLLNQKKNSLLEESVNKNFKLVTWRLFKFQKNGEVLNDCTPMIDGKDFESCSNGALKVLAKLDIIDGLQRYYNQFYPVFADDFALVTSETESRIDMDCQLVTLVADSRSETLLIGGM